MAASELPGTYRVENEARVEFSDAMAAWVPLAYDALLATAQRYQAVITYKELSDHVREVSGITTRMLLANWIGKLLEEVARRARDDGRPPLTSLCVHQDGTIGQGYAQAPKATADEDSEDIEYYAAGHRLLCYRAYAKDLPADGGKPALTAAVSARRARSVAPDPIERPRCPACFTELPTAGKCDYCD